MSRSATKKRPEDCSPLVAVLPERIIVRLANHNHKSEAKEIQFAPQWIVGGNQGASGDTSHAHGGHVGLISSYQRRPSHG